MSHPHAAAAAGARQAPAAPAAQPQQEPPVGYLRPRALVLARPGEVLTLGDLAEVRGPEEACRTVRRLPWGQAPARGGHRVASLLDLVAAASRAAPGVRWQAVGDRDVLVASPERPGPHRWLLGALVWLLLFVGAATTLLNFHADVNMPAAHRQLYYLATGRVSRRPLAVEVPYAIGLGLGALLFFAVPRRPGSDPGPLELELVRYEERLRAYWRERLGGRVLRRGGRP